MSKIMQAFLSILLFLTLVFTTISLTVLNERFVLMVIKKSQVSEKIAYKEKREFEEVKKDLLQYVQSGYQEDKLEKIKDESLGDRQMLTYFKWGNYFCTFFFLVLTGNIFVKTKQKHDLSFLLFISGILLILFFGGCTLLECSKSILFHTLYQVVVHIFLALGILFIEISFITRIKVKRLS